MTAEQEHGIVDRAIVRRPGADLHFGLTTANRGLPDHEAALAQHRRYVEELVGLGVAVTELEPLQGFPDAYFVEDVAVIVGDAAVIARPGAGERLGEEEAMATVLEALMPVERISEPATLDGGDVLEIGGRFVIGVSDRTNEEGVAQLGRLLAERGITWSAMSVGSGLHLKSSVAALDAATLLLTSEYADRTELAGWQHVVVAPGEEAAANALAINGTVLLPDGCPQTVARVEAAGFAVRVLEVSEAQKMDGGLSCMSLRFRA